MAIRLMDENDPGEWTFWKNDPETRAAIRFRVRRPEPGFARKLLKEHSRNLRSSQIVDMPAPRAFDRSAEITIAKAAHVLVDSEGFAVQAGSAADALARHLGMAVKQGDEILLDGKWSAEIKDLVLRRAEPLSAWLCEQADKLTGLQADDEEAAADSFR